MYALLVAWIVAASVVVLAAGVGCCWVVVQSRRNPHPFDGYGFAGFSLMGIMALVAVALALGRAEGAWVSAALVAVNVVMQPLCLSLFAAGAYKVAMAAAGHVVYAWRTMPPGECPPEAYRALRWYCVMQGVIGCSFAAGLSWLCASPPL
jgi:hypothetical protein